MATIQLVFDLTKNEFVYGHAFGEDLDNIASVTLGKDGATVLGPDGRDLLVEAAKAVMSAPHPTKAQQDVAAAFGFDGSPS